MLRPARAAQAENPWVEQRLTSRVVTASINLDGEIAFDRILAGVSFHFARYGIKANDCQGPWTTFTIVHDFNLPLLAVQQKFVVVLCLLVEHRRSLRSARNKSFAGSERSARGAARNLEYLERQVPINRLLVFDVLFVVVDLHQNLASDSVVHALDAHLDKRVEGLQNTAALVLWLRNFGHE